MLHFFRTYQKYFFLLITIVIVTTFVFFGTYQAFAPRGGGDEVAFTTLDGKKITKNHLAHLCHFLKDEQSAYGLGNFLNDGVISKELFETKRAAKLFAVQGELFKEELQTKLTHELEYKPYVHPQTPLLSAEQAWNLFAPELLANLKKLQGIKGGIQELFDTKVALYLAEKKFPGELLAQILRYQEREHEGIIPDMRLAEGSVNLFGYRDLQEWFGPQFIECVAKVIIQGAATARERGIHASRNEVVADLAIKSSRCLQEKRNEIPSYIQNGSQLLKAYMQERGLDDETLVSIWQEVLLFRRLFQQMNSSLTFDHLGLNDFYAFAHEKIELEIAQIPEAFRFTKASDVKKFEHYLELTAVPKKSPLDIPLESLQIAEVRKREPKLIKHRFQVELAKVTKKELESKVTVKETWEWEGKKENLKRIKEQFKAERLDDLSSKERAPIDTFARAEIVNSHPEWIEKALEEKKTEEKELVLHELTTSECTLEGIKDEKALLEKLRARKITAYTQDGSTYYTMIVKSEKEEEIVSFEEALQLNVLKEKPSDEVFTKLGEKLIREKKIGADVHPEKLNDLVAPWRFVELLASQKGEDEVGAYGKQFLPLRKEDVVTRAQAGFVTFADVKDLPEHSVGTPHLSKHEGLYQLKVVAKHIDRTPPLAQIIEAQKRLSEECGNHYFDKMIASWTK